MLKISIIIRAYNAEKTIERAVKSALSQDFSGKDFETIVVNDGSTDNTREILKQFESLPNVRVIDQENSQGKTTANRGLKESRGEYVTLLDDDDTFEAGLLKELSAVLDKNPDIDFVYPDYYEDDGVNKKVVSTENIFNTVAIGILFRRDKFAAEGFYREGPIFIEYDLLLRTWGRWKGYHYPKPLFTYFRSKDSNTASAELVEHGMEELRKLYPQHTELVDKIRKY